MKHYNSARLRFKHIFSFFLGAFFIFVVSCWTGLADQPAVLRPLSLTTFIPLVFLNLIIRLPLMAAWTNLIVMPTIYLLWSFPLISGQTEIPLRSKISFIILTILSFSFLVICWPYGVQFQGIHYTVMIYIYNIAFLSALLIIWRANKKHSSYITNFLFHLFLFSWLASVAFPWLGELF